MIKITKELVELVEDIMSIVECYDWDLDEVVELYEKYNGDHHKIAEILEPKWEERFINE